MRKLITMIACLAITGGAFAQGIDIPRFTLGAKAGLNVSNFAGKDMRDVDAKAKAGFHIGVVGEFKASKFFVIAPEIMFSSQGFRTTETYDGGGGTYKSSINANYINIPIMLRFYVIDALSLEVGPQFGFAVGVKAKAKDGDFKESYKLDRGEEYNTFDFAIGLGATYNFKHKFFASARYNFGLTNVLIENDPLSNKNGVFQLSVGCNFFSF